MVVVEFKPVNQKYNSGRVFRNFDEELNLKKTSFPKADILENEKEYFFFIELPGLIKENIKVNFEKNSLTIAGERKKFMDDKNANKILKQETFSGSFKRTFRFIDNIFPDSITAKFEDGLLIINLKKEVPQELVIEVN